MPSGRPVARAPRLLFYMKPHFLPIFLMLISLPLSSVEPVWQDEFNRAPGEGPDPSRWIHDLGATGWGNAELQEYTNSPLNARIVEDPAASDGRALALRAVRDERGRFTSARLKTEGKFAMTYGRVEARIRVPRGQGIWPAFWMLGETFATAGWPHCGEIDIMEVVGHEPGRLHQTLHGPGYSGGAGLTHSLTLPGGASLSDGYHVYAVERSPGRIVWLFDGRVTRVLTPADLPPGAKWVFDDAPFFLLLNVAVGGRWPGYPDDTTTFPQEMRIDYVRVYPLAEDTTRP